MPNIQLSWIELFTILLIPTIIGIVVYVFQRLQKNSKIKELQDKLSRIRQNYELIQANHNQLIDDYQALDKKLQVTLTTHKHVENTNEELRMDIQELENKIIATDYQYQELKLSYSQKNSEILHLQEKLKEEREDLNRLNQKFETEFENLANKILEEKSNKFTLQNRENLNHILKPFQEKMNELKNAIHDSYEKENKQRFSLGEKVKELAELNLQISEDAKKLTRALKSESKTQGNWGEMILENILEKSGLVKGREFFMEYQLKDENNKTLYSEFSGKKMRPDAVVKYPDKRNVIIDSKVSLNAFLEAVEEPDEEIYQIKINQHLSSIKNHIQQLSQKAYDDYDKSLDFVMMFIPNEAAYIAAMQADPNLWHYAYNKRILLLNPSNLITSLKLLADLWKRDYQNKNALEIAERGSKLYEKFVGFIQNLDDVGKHIEKSQEAYEKAYKQLSTGRDNLVNQTQKLKNLGLKTKNDISSELVRKSKLDNE